MADLTTIKTQISALSYEDKIALSSWIHTEIQAGMAENTKKSMEKLDTKTEGFLNKARSIFKINS